MTGRDPGAAAAAAAATAAGADDPGGDGDSRDDSGDDVFILLAALTDLLLSWSYEGTAGAERIVTEVAGRYGAEVEVAFLPDVAILTSGDRTTSRAATPVVPPLHQVSALKRVLAAIAGGDLPAAEAVRRIDAVRRLPPRFGTPARVAGLVLFSVGFGISLQATWQEVVASGVLGLLVGLVVVTTEPHPPLALAAPFAASVAVAVLALVAVDQGWVHGGPIPLMVPALFYFIPGDALAAAMLELAAGRITAGASRLTYSLAILLLLAFGALVATTLAGESPGALVDTDVAGTLGPLAVWGGWVLFAAGVMLTFSMAPADFGWALAMVLGTAAVTALAGAAVGDPVGTFAGALAMTVAALLLGRRPGLPPPYVLYLGAFYVLTPGSVGLRGLESWIGGARVQGLTGLAEMAGLLAAIAVGMLVGTALVPRPLASGM